MGLIKKIGGICNCYSLHCVTEAAYDNTDVFYIILNDFGTGMNTHTQSPHDMYVHKSTYKASSLEKFLKCRDIDSHTATCKF